MSGQPTDLGDLDLSLTTALDKAQSLIVRAIEDADEAACRDRLGLLNTVQDLTAAARRIEAGIGLIAILMIVAGILRFFHYL